MRQLALLEPPCRTGVITVQPVSLNYLNQLGSICGTGCIAGSLKTCSPPLVVSCTQLEKRLVTGSAYKELRMVAVRLLGITVTAETLMTLVIIMIHLAPLPVTVALDPEMVVAFCSQRAAPGI